jgi:hypothetical protein
VLAEARLPAWRPLRAAAVAITAGLLLPAVPFAIPLLEPAATVAWMERLGLAPVRTERAFTQRLPQHQADQLGWPGQVAAVEAVVQGLPPVISGHNQFFLWGVPGAPTVVVALGGRTEDYAGDFREVTLAARAWPGRLRPSAWTAGPRRPP